MIDEGRGGVIQPERDPARRTPGLCRLLPEMENSGEREGSVKRDISYEDIGNDRGYRLRDEVIEEQEKCISVFEAEDAQDCPEQSVLETDISVKIHFFA